jgi:hypothetical protein
MVDATVAQKTFFALKWTCHKSDSRLFHGSLTSEPPSITAGYFSYCNTKKNTVIDHYAWPAAAGGFEHSESVR